MQAVEPTGIHSRRIVLRGRVQGVGFRPYIYRHACQHHLAGWVRNISGRVEIQVQGELSDVDNFIATVIDDAPLISSPCIESVEDSDAGEGSGFRIVDSYQDMDADIHLPVDLYTCPTCRDELNAPADHRYRYPFINCTQCGPRYTIIESLPYDRENTSMAGFELCAHCDTEYSDVMDRRYHAEPVACEHCGPVLSFSDDMMHVTGNEDSLKSCVDALSAGWIVAIKGVGGYHLACDARNDDAVLNLRRTKPRPHKPLAVMFPENAIYRYLKLSQQERAVLESSARPIVLVDRSGLQSINNRLSSYLSPGVDSIGAMLPYSPLHYLLLQEFGAPLVMTSANISGEPVLTDNQEVEQRLGHVAQAYLHHDRGIVRPADDSVVRIIAGRTRPVRLGRGLAPLELELPFRLERPVLAVGCHMKNTVTLAWNDRAVVSPHIGEMDNVRSMQVFESTIEDLQTLYKTRAELLICDAHPGYGSTKWAQQQSLPLHEVYHHHAHASVAWHEASRQDAELEQMLVFTWDGIGLGPDGSLWGGDALLGRAGHWQRVAHFKPFRLPGGERAGREPWRSAAAICWQQGIDYSIPEYSTDMLLLHKFWKQDRNSPGTTAAGRLFDAAAALTEVCTDASYEGQGPMWLEAIAEQDIEPVMLPAVEGDTYVVDWSPLVDMLQDSTTSREHRAGCFHSSMAHALLQQALHVREICGNNNVGLSGGVFQNRLLTEMAVSLLGEHGFRVFLPEQVPVNDAGISFGQLIDYAWSTTSRTQ